MNIYLIQADTSGYDVYNSAVVVAETTVEASMMHPRDGYTYSPTRKGWFADYDGSIGSYETDSSIWSPTPDKVTVTLIGVASSQYTKHQVVCASFHAG